MSSEQMLDDGRESFATNSAPPLSGGGLPWPQPTGLISPAADRRSLPVRGLSSSAWSPSFDAFLTSRLTTTSAQEMEQYSAAAAAASHQAMVAYEQASPLPHLRARHIGVYRAVRLTILQSWTLGSDIVSNYIKYNIMPLDDCGKPQSFGLLLLPYITQSPLLKFWPPGMAGNCKPAISLVRATSPHQVILACVILPQNERQVSRQWSHSSAPPFMASGEGAGSNAGGTHSSQAMPWAAPQDWCTAATNAAPCHDLAAKSGYRSCAFG